MDVRRKIKQKLGPAQILNHSSKDLLVIENTSGKKPIAHVLGPKRKSPAEIDADGFRRLDANTIFGHKSWWKIFDGATADIWQLGSDILIPTSLMMPVSDEHFGRYSVESGSSWGEKLNYVTARVKNRRGQVVGYIADSFGRISKRRAIQLAKSGQLDNVVIGKSSNGTIFLRTKKNMSVMDNLSA